MLVCIPVAGQGSQPDPEAERQAHFVLFIFSQHPEEHMIPREILGWVSSQWRSASRAIGFIPPFETKRRVLGINLPMSQNSTKKTKTSLRQLQKHLSTTIDLWTKTADELERQAGESEDPNMKEALYLPAAIYRTCCVDLKGVLDGRVILDKQDKAFQEMPALIDQGGN